MLIQRARGFSLIELLVALTLAGLFMALAAPSFSIWVQNSRIRATADSIAAGLQLAKAEAVSHNGLVRFQLTDTLTDACSRSTSGVNWVIDMVDGNAAQDSVENQCDAAPSETVAPRILHVRASAEGSGSSVVAASADSLIFNSLGKLSPLPAGNTVIDVTNPSGGACAAEGGDLSCLRIIVSPAGQVRMCNPRIPTGDPQAC